MTHAAKSVVDTVSEVANAIGIDVTETTKAFMSAVSWMEKTLTTVGSHIAQLDNATQDTLMVSVSSTAAAVAGASDAERQTIISALQQAYPVDDDVEVRRRRRRSRRLRFKRSRR